MTAAVLAAEVDQPPRVVHRRGFRMSVVFTGAFAATGFGLGLRALHDNSFMWHLRTGRLILDHGIPHSDPYSFSARGAPWVAQSWLAELGYAVIDRAFGPFGLRIFGALVGALVAGSLYHIAWRTSRDRVRAFGLSLIAIAVLLNVWSERPLMLGLLAMIAVVAIVELPDSTLGRHPRVALPIIFWLWANVHGTFALGFLYLTLHVATEVWDGRSLRRGRVRDLAVGLAVSAVVVFVNPYGIDLVLFPVHLLGRGSVLSTVAEWQSPNFRDAGGQLFGLWIVTTIVVLARRGAHKRDLLVAIVFLALGLWAIRNVGLAAVAGLPVLARAARRREVETPATPEECRALNGLVLVMLTVLVAALAVRAGRESAWNLKKYPVDAVGALREHRLVGHRLLTTDAWAGYLILDAWPEQHVFFDDRYDMYPAPIDDAYDTLARLRPGWATLLDRDHYDIDVIMWPKSGALAQALAESREWVQRYADRVSVVFVRRAGPP